MYRKILVVVDDRLVTQSAIRQAIEMAQVHRAVIHFLYVLPTYFFTSLDITSAKNPAPEVFEKDAKDHAASMLTAASELAESFGVHSFSSVGSDSQSARYVVDIAEHKHCDLIVVGTEGRSAVLRLLSGNIVPGLISQASVPVLICRDTGLNNGLGRRSLASARARTRRQELTARRQIEEASDKKGAPKGSKSTH
jgi:nucleotide-binding universal stress UspA family protein